MFDMPNIIILRHHPRRPQNPQPSPKNMEESVRNIIREAFRIEPKNQARVYQKPYPNYFDNIPYPRGFRVPKFTKFNGEDSTITWEHINQFLVQCGEDAFKIRLFSSFLSGTVFTWFTSLMANSIYT